MLILLQEDFIEEEGEGPYAYPPNRLHVLYFIHFLKLSEIMGLVLRQQFTVASEKSRRMNKNPDISHCDMALGAWMSNLPEELRYRVIDPCSHNFFVALLHLHYYTILCLLHRTNFKENSNIRQAEAYPSRGIAFQAAHMVARIIQNVKRANELRLVPAFIVYTLFSALIMLVYQSRSRTQSVVESAQRAISICMSALDEVGEQWMVGRMILKLFEKINQNKQIQDKLIKFFTPRQQQQQQQQQQQMQAQTSMGMNAPMNLYSNLSSQEVNNYVFQGSGNDNSGMSMYKQKASEAEYVTPPVPNLSYERSRTSTPVPAANGPAVMPRIERPESFNGRGANSETSERNPQLQDSTLSAQSYFSVVTPSSLAAGTQRQGQTDQTPGFIRSTGPSTPFQPSFSIPGTPPEFFLVTQSPQVSQAFFENFQPSQLFPDDIAQLLLNNGIYTAATGTNAAPMYPSQHMPGNPEIDLQAVDVSAQKPTWNVGDDRRTDASREVSVGVVSTASPVLMGPSYDMSGNALQDDQFNSMSNFPSSASSGMDSTLNGEMVPNSLNIGDWVQYLTMNGGGIDQAFTAELAELAQSTGMTINA